MIICHTEIEVELTSSISTEDVMLVHERWRVSTGAGSAKFEQTLHPTLVLRMIEGAWKLSIAVPWSRHEPAVRRDLG